jgi:sporulation protein YlmC with PRC-barrel domain
MNLNRHTLFAATGALALLASAPVFAADPGASGAKTMTEPKGGAGMQSQGRFKASGLMGKDLQNMEGKTIGDVESVIVDDDGQVTALVVGIGGFLGLGERNVAISWKDVNTLGQGKILRTNLTKSQLEALPDYKYKNASNKGKAFKDPTYRSGMSGGTNLGRPGASPTRPTQ